MGGDGVPSRDLTTFRNHCRKMAERAHPPRTAYDLNGRKVDLPVTGTDEEIRAQWASLAAEADQRLASPDPEPVDDLDREPTPDDVPLIGD